jgi:hypothetical protein
MTIAAVDICNRALQKIGAARIASLTEDSRNAAECAACYDILREAELRRNVWRCSVRRSAMRAVDTTSFTYVPATWSGTALYPINAIAIYNGVWYQSLVANNLDNTPADDSTAWTAYFASPMATPYDSSLSYFLGELVYTPSTTGAKVYLSLANGNADAPTTTPPAWDATITYGLGVFVTAADTVVYVSKAALNLNLNPTGGGNSTYWATVSGSQTQQPIGNWLLLDGTLSAVNIIYPAGTGPASDSTTRNVFLLPRGYLRDAPQNPKAGQSSVLGFPSNRAVTDWVFENSFLVSVETGPIVFRFAANITNAAEFDPLLREGLAARVGMELCEPLTQAQDKLQAVTKAYERAMGEARMVNGIEQGPVEQPLDDYIATRF